MGVKSPDKPGVVLSCCDSVQPLEAGRGKRIPKQLQQPEEPENTATVVYTGHIPHGFYEEQMQVYHVAKVVADEMNNYLLFEHTLRVALVPPEKVHPKLWKGVLLGFMPIDRVAIDGRDTTRIKLQKSTKRWLKEL
uniref:Uncharacterized protein n=1 Tax=Setaria viridis TaxID=4556 RepID=A0A4U6U7K1_SETVI|nr:hypothetical protein SEVIR_6G148200v2 [Setaria viridis]